MDSAPKTFTSYFKSPLGWIRITSTDEAITSLDFCESSAPDAATACSNEAPGETSSPLPKPMLSALIQLDQYFSRARGDFNLPLAYETGTSFQHQVWDALRTIPFGTTVSYQDVARMIGSPKSARAVGGANNKNPLAIVIPCHRVIASSGELTGYAGELWRKKALLELEQGLKRS